MSEQIVISNHKLTRDICELAVKAPGIAGTAIPGQFLMIKVTDNLDPLLRRPLAVHGVRSDEICILNRALGKGTSMIALLGAGNKLDILGPLGKGFTWSGKGPFMLVAGGMGMTPLGFLGQRMVEAGAHFEIHWGVKTFEEFFFSSVIEELRSKIKSYHTDDGSYGEKGSVCDGLASAIAEASPQTIFACGPPPMIREVARIARECGVSCQISVEERMACGIGACLGCAIETKDGNYLRVCKDGPVFNGKEIML